MEIESLFDTAIVTATASVSVTTSQLHHKQREGHTVATATKINDSSFVAQNESDNQDENVNNLAMLASLSLQKVLNINNINNSKSSHNGLINNGMSACQKHTSEVSTKVIKVKQQYMNQQQGEEFKAENGVLKKLLKNGAILTAATTAVADTAQNISATNSIIKQLKQKQEKQQKQANSTQKQRLNSSISSTNSSTSTSSSMTNSYGSFCFFTEDASRTTTSSTAGITSPITKSSNTKLPEKLKIPSDILDDLASRFIINVPDMELNNLIRICFQIELAHWFYLDFFCAPDDSEAQQQQHKRKLPTVGFKQFAVQLFKHIPFLNKHVGAVDCILVEWKEYKLSVPTCGAILVSEDLNHCLLVQSYFARNSWGFPKGKINENENTAHCAIREVYEETGFDITDIINADDYIEAWINYQYTRLYIVCSIPLNTQFAPRTRNEIKCCDWFRIDALPINKNDAISKAKLGKNSNSFFMIMPFVKRLKKWVNDRRAGIEPSSCRRKCSGHRSPNDILYTVSSTSPTLLMSTKKEQQRTSRRQRHKSMGDLDCINSNNFNGKAGGGGASSATSNIYNSNSKRNHSYNKQQNLTAGSNTSTTTTTAKLLPVTTAIVAATTTSKRQLFHSQSQNDAQQPTNNDKIVSSFDLIRKEKQQQLKAGLTQKQQQQRLHVSLHGDKQYHQPQQLEMKSIVNKTNTQKQQQTTPTTGMDLIAMLTTAAASQKIPEQEQLPQRPRPASVSLNSPIATMSGATNNGNPALNTETLLKLQRRTSGRNSRILKQVQSQQLQNQQLHQQQLQQNRPFNFTPSFNSWTNFSFTKNFMANVFC